MGSYTFLVVIVIVLNPSLQLYCVFKRLTYSRAFDFVLHKQWHLLGDEFGVPKIAQSRDTCSAALYEPVTNSEREMLCQSAKSITQFQTKYLEMRTKVLARGVFRDQVIHLTNPCQQILDFYDQIKRY